NPLLVGMLHGLTDRDEDLQPGPQSQPPPVAVLRDRVALDELHHEERLIGRRGAAVEDAGDVGVIHQGQRLTLGIEPGQDGPRIHTDLDQLESDLALDGLGLIGAVDGAHPAFAEDVSECVPTCDDPAGDEAFVAGVVGDARGPSVVASCPETSVAPALAASSIAPLGRWTAVASTVPTPTTVAGAWDPGRASDAEV